MAMKEPRFPAGWILIGEEELARVERSIRDRDWEGAGILLKEALEKFLKAFLLKKGRRFGKEDELEALLETAISCDSSLERFRPTCKNLILLYTITRHPVGSEPGFTGPKVKELLDGVRELIEMIRLWVSGDAARSAR